MKVLLKVPLNPYSGYGNDGIGLALLLQRYGVDVYLDPACAVPPLPPVVADLLTKRLTAPFDLLIHHVDPGQLGLTPEVRRAANVCVGWTMWEYTSLDNLKGRTKLRKLSRGYDVVAAYDTVSKQALSAYVPEDRLIVAQGGYWSKDWPYVERDWESDRFGFCMVGALHQRKDPFVAIQAFHDLKQEHPEEFEPAELHLKTNIPGLHSAMEQWIPKLRVHYNVWPEDVLREFYALQHCLLAPSRGEGKNMPALEFQSTGGVVIATKFGGHLQWLNNEYGYGLDCDLQPESVHQPRCLSARARKEHLKELMLHVFRNRQEAKAKGKLASKYIPELCDWDASVLRLFEGIRSATGDGTLWNEFNKLRDNYLISRVGNAQR